MTLLPRFLSRSIRSHTSNLIALAVGSALLLLAPLAVQAQTPGEVQDFEQLAGQSRPLDVDDGFGRSATRLGDVDGDGVPDLLVGTPGDDDGATDAGAAYILFPNADGTVKTQQKISATAGGLAPGTLESEDFFGSSATGLGDVDGDTVPDVLISAPRDDDGAVRAGAAYVLFLNTDGTVKNQQKISATAGGLASGTLESDDFFGIGAAELGDLDGDGVPDVLVSASGDDEDAGSGIDNTGAAYVLFLNADGTVDTQQKISNDTGGLDSGTLTAEDRFGSSAAGLGDLDNDNVPDVLVGAFGDSDGATGAGAAYVLFMDTDGTVKTQQKISNTTGGLASGTLNFFDTFGSSAAQIGDVDGDGVPDVLVGAESDDSDVGAAFVLFMNTDGTVRDQQKIGTSEGGLASGTLEGGDFFGSSAVGLGDLNGDSVPEVLIGATGDDEAASNAGTTYALLLNSNGTVQAQRKVSVPVSGLASGTLSFDDRFGRSAAEIGDLDGDGVPDALIGAPRDDDGASNAGAAYVLFLNADGTVKDQQKISATTGGLASGTLASDDFFGSSIAGLGDLNGDGVPDVLVGADADGDSADGAGAAYVLFLNTDGTVNTQQKISNGTGGLNSGTLSSFDRFGTSAAEIGDLDNDGVSDVLIGALGDDDGADDAGAAYVLYMNTDGTVDTQQKISEDTGSLAANLDELDFFGTSAAGLGDLDGNGVPDVLVGASGDDDGADGAGAAYVLFLNANGTVNTQQKISDGTGGLASGTLGSFNSFGSSATSVGDLDADGVSDILVGVPGDNDGVSSAGATYVLFLNADGTVNAQQKISDGTGGFPTGTLASEDRFGESVAEIGDLNGDGIPDVLVGANEDDSRDGAGQVRAGTAYALFLDGSETCTNGPSLLSFEAIGVDIDFASGTAGSGCITASRFDDAPTGTQNIPSENNVSDYRVVISSDASLNVGTNTEVRLDVNRFGGINTPDNVTVYARPDVGSGAFNALPTSDESAGGTTEIVAQVDGFSEFVLASPTDPLPIELQELTVQQSNRRAQVQWSTASETNNAGFYVQTQSLSADSTTTESAWTTLGFVEGAGTTDAPQSYQFETDKLPYGAHAFRLRQVDTDGTETTTDPVTVEVQLDRAYVVEAPYPNPSREQATLPVTVRETQRVQVALYDMLGRRISTVHDGEVPSQDTESIQLDTGQLASGTYFVRVRGEDFTTTERLTVVR